MLHFNLPKPEQATTVAGGTLGAPSIAGTHTGTTPDDGTGEHDLAPLFKTEFVLEPYQIRFAPDLDEYQEGIAEVIQKFQECVLGVENLVPDGYFDAFTR